MADRLEKGEAVRVPSRAGLFTVRYANLRSDPYGVKPVPCLWIAEYGPPLLGEDRHAIGFLRAAPHVSRAWKPEGRFTWIMVSHLTGDWFQTDED